MALPGYGTFEFGHLLRHLLEQVNNSKKALSGIKNVLFCQLGPSCFVLHVVAVGPHRVWKDLI